VGLSRRLLGVWGMRYVQVGERWVVGCGGGGRLGKGQEVYSVRTVCVEVESGLVQDWADMRIGRGLHGLIEHSGAIYAFGGFPVAANSGLSAEFTLFAADQHWSDLPNMAFPRYMFTPCIWLSCIYLCGGPSGFMEIFLPKQLKYQLSPIYLSNSSAMLVFTHNKELVIITRSEMLLFNEKLEERRVKRGFGEVETSTLPVVWRGFVFAVRGQTCGVYDLGTGKRGNCV